jgi:hypothetical protein
MENLPHHVGNPVTAKAMLVGAACAGIIAVGEPWGVLIVHGSPLAADFSTGGAIFIFSVVILLLNPTLRFIHPHLPLNPGELLTVYAMMLVASAIPSWGFTMNLLPLIAGFFYYATPENDWKGLIIPYLASWAVPDDQEAITRFFEGAPAGSGVPWVVWIRPLIAWGILIVAAYVAMICLMVIVRKRWMEEEKIVYPLAQLPIELVQKEEHAVFPTLFKDSLFWVGVAVPAGINTLNALHAQYSFIIGIPLQGTISLFPGGQAWGGQAAVRVMFEVIGLSYLLNLEIAFSLWFFALFAVIERGIFDRIGFSIGPYQPFSDPAPPSVAHQALGALIVIVVAGLWGGRRHLKEIFRGAMSRQDTQDEILTPRWAVVGLCTGLVVTTTWLVLAGLQVPYAILTVVSAFVIFLGLTRAVAEGGMAYGRAPVNAPVFVVNAVGSSALGPPGLAALGLMFAWATDVRTLVMASTANGLKLADAARIRTARFFWALVLSIIVSLAGSAWAILTFAYTHGGINLVGWHFIGLPGFAGSWMTLNLANPSGMTVWHMVFTLIGGAMAALLLFLRHRFLSWSLHPIGLAVGPTLPMYFVWFSVMLAWLFKWAILKYGGVKAYRRARPFFLGLILGDFGSAGLWIIIDGIVGWPGHVFTLT